MPCEKTTKGSAPGFDGPVGIYSLAGTLRALRVSVQSKVWLVYRAGSTANASGEVAAAASVLRAGSSGAGLAACTHSAPRPSRLRASKLDL